MRRGIIGGWPVRAEVVEQAAVADQTAVTIEEQRPAPPPPGPPVEPPPERELWPWLVVLLVLVLAGIAVVYFATRDDKSQPQAATPAPVPPTTVPASPTRTAVRTPAPSARVTVPRLVGLTAPVALTRLRQLGLTVNTQNVFSEKPPTVVVAQTPGSSRKLAKGETVMLNISKGPRAVAVPDVVGQTAADALSTLQAQAFKPRIVRVPSVEPAGQVVAQDPKADAKASTGRCGSPQCLGRQTGHPVRQGKHANNDRHCQHEPRDRADNCGRGERQPARTGARPRRQEADRRAATHPKSGPRDRDQASAQRAAARDGDRTSEETRHTAQTRDAPADHRFEGPKASDVDNIVAIGLATDRRSRRDRRRRGHSYPRPRKRRTYRSGRRPRHCRGIPRRDGHRASPNCEPISAAEFDRDNLRRPLHQQLGALIMTLPSSLQGSPWSCCSH